MLDDISKSIERFYEIKYIKDEDYLTLDVSYDVLAIVVEDMTKKNIIITKIELR